MRVDGDEGALRLLDAPRAEVGESVLHLNRTEAFRRVVELALAHNASAVLLAHNHVSGLALPSNADLLTTETLARVLREVGVELADHLIFTEDDMVSLKDSGLLNGYPNPY